MCKLTQPEPHSSVWPVHPRKVQLSHPRARYQPARGYPSSLKPS